MFGLIPKTGKHGAPRQKYVECGRDIAVAGRRIPLVIRENKRATRLTLRIEPGGNGLKLSAPHGISDREIDQFLQRHHGWLTNKLAKIPKAALIEEGSVIAIRDIPHQVVRSGKLRGISEVLNEGDEYLLSVGGAPEHAGRRVVDYLKKQARLDLQRHVGTHSGAIGKRVASLQLKDTKSRWGSCTSTGRLSFSWRIIMAPEFVIDYLAAHEVAHLREMNHGPRFWKLCYELCPRTDEAKGWLKRHGSALHAIDFGN